MSVANRAGFLPSQRVSTPAVDHSSTQGAPGAAIGKTGVPQSPPRTLGALAGMPEASAGMRAQRSVQSQSPLRAKLSIAGEGGRALFKESQGIAKHHAGNAAAGLKASLQKNGIQMLGGAARSALTELPRTLMHAAASGLSGKEALAQFATEKITNLAIDQGAKVVAEMKPLLKQEGQSALKSFRGAQKRTLTSVGEQIAQRRTAQAANPQVAHEPSVAPATVPQGDNVKDAVD